MPETATSDCPTPTVSTRMTSYPAASSTSIDSRVARATPPRCPDDGEGRTKASGRLERSAMRVRSPRMEPPVLDELGSTASTATLWWCSVMSLTPMASMNVDLPAPGTPEMPTRNAFPVWGARCWRSSCARGLCAGLVDSTSVIARATWPREFSRTFSANCSIVRFHTTPP